MTLYWRKNVVSFLKLFTCESDEYTFTVKNLNRISLEEQWIRIHLPKQRTRVQSPTPGRFHIEWSNYEPLCHNYWACTPRVHTVTTEAPSAITCALPEKPMHCNREKPLLVTKECPRAATKTQCNQKIQITQMWSLCAASSCHAHPTAHRDHFHHVARPQTFLCNPVMQEFSVYSFLLKHPVEGTVSLLICKLYYFFFCKINVSLRKNLCLECDLHNA